MINENPLTGTAIRVLAEHAVALTDSIVLLTEQDMLIQAAPLIRLTMECGVTAAWLSVAPNAGNEANHEAARQRRAIFEGMLREAALEDEQSLADAREIVQDLAEHQSEAARKFERRCNQIVGGKELYVHYRILSDVSHAGLGLMDQYLLEADRNSETTEGYALVSPANYRTADVAFGYQVAMLCLTLTAWDNLIKEHPRSAKLQGVADRFDCSRAIQWVHNTK